LHIEAKRGKGRVRDGGASKENMCFFPGEGFKGVGGFKVFLAVVGLGGAGRESRSLASEIPPIFELKRRIKLFS
jgi:hypothetical protein